MKAEYRARLRSPGLLIGRILILSCPQHPNRERPMRSVFALWVIGLAGCYHATVETGATPSTSAAPASARVSAKGTSYSAKRDALSRAVTQAAASRQSVYLQF